MGKTYKLFVTIIIILLFVYTKVNSQHNTLYWMNHLPQQLNENPGKKFDCKFFIDLPVIPNFSFNVNHSGFNISDAIKAHPSAADSFMIDLNGIESALRKKNTINFETNLSILNFGFSVGNNMFFSFGINYKVYENFQYPKDLIELKNGNYREDGSPISLDFGQNLMVHREIFIGASKEIYGNINVGARIKYLSGYANINTKNLKIDWYTETHPDSMYEWTFNSDINIRAAAPVEWEVAYDSIGKITGIDYNTDFTDNPATHIKDYIFPGNTGFAIDLGAEYTLFDKFTFSASVIDLGFIKWKSNPAILTQNASFKFSGIDIASMITNTEDSDQGGVTEELMDTLLTVFNPAVENTAYTTGLNTKIYAGANYMVTDWFDAGILYRGMFSNNKLYSSYTVSANTNFLKGWSYTISFSIMDGFSGNLGMGLAYKIGPFQTYIITDNIAVPFWAMNESTFSDNWLTKTKRFNLSFGMNFVICGNKNGDIGLLE